MSKTAIPTPNEVDAVLGNIKKERLENICENLRNAIVNAMFIGRRDLSTQAILAGLLLIEMDEVIIKIKQEIDEAGWIVEWDARKLHWWRK